mgnify:CR=1 FL=1
MSTCIRYLQAPAFNLDVYCRPVSQNEEDLQKRIKEKRRERIELLREVQRTPSPDQILTFITQLEREAESRTSRRAGSRGTRLSSRMQSAHQSELNFNPRHLEVFDKIRAKQKKRFFSNIKL